MKLLITGATGRIGSHLWPALLALGHDVLATDLSFPISGGSPGPFRVADLLNRSEVYQLMEGRDVVIHLANHPNEGKRYPDSSLLTENVTMNAHVFTAAIECGIRRILFASSTQVFRYIRCGHEGVIHKSSLPYLPADGHLPARPSGVYGLSKQFAEEHLRCLCELHRDLSAVALRFPAMLNHINDMAFDYDKITNWRKRMVYPDELFSFLRFNDANDLIGRLLTRASTGMVTLFPASRQNLLKLPAPRLIERFYPGIPLREAIGDNDGLVSVQALHDAFGWQPTAEP